MHTTHIFDTLKSKLANDAKIECFRIPGFDDNSYATLNDMIVCLRRHLKQHKYDVIIAHSLGCYLVLKCMNNVGDANIIFCNPLYKNLRFWIVLISPFIKSIELLKGLYIRNCNSILIKLALFPTCINIKCIDNRILRMLERPNINVAVRTMNDIIFENNDYINCIYDKRITIVYGKYDFIVKTPKKLIKLFKKVDLKLLPCGHSSILEMENIIVNIARKMLKTKQYYNKV